MQEETVDLLVVGGGPAGLAAAAVGTRCGLHTVLVDERPTLGGQIYKQPGPGFRVRGAFRRGKEQQRAQRLFGALCASGAHVRPTTSLVAIRGTSAVCYNERSAETLLVHARQVVVAAGAHDRPVSFPGWTLPGVVSAGGAQSLVKTARVAIGERVAFVGSGPVALGFPAQLSASGIGVILVLEAGPPPDWRAVMRVLGAAPGNYSLLFDGLRYRMALAAARVPVRYRRIVVRVEGHERAEVLVHAAVDDDWRVVPGTEEEVAVDTVCVGYGFCPSDEALRLAGCEFDFDEDLGGPVVVRDLWGQTTVPGVLAAGDCTGVRGAVAAEAQGELAGLAAAQNLRVLKPGEALRIASPLMWRLARLERFRRTLLRLYRIGPGLYELAMHETVVCRCEEVTVGELLSALGATHDPDVLKAVTRVGMGLCQGRNCRRQVSTLLRTGGAKAHEPVRPGRPLLADTTPRPPLRPVPLGAVADETVLDGGLFFPTKEGAKGGL